MDLLKRAPLPAARRALPLLALLALVLAPAVRAQLSPGKLAQGHGHLEGLDNCAKCHSNKVRSSADPMLCRECHEAIDLRMREGRGLHGREKLEKCGKCHPDHLGRNFDLIQWKTMGEPREKFRHERTGYPLEGAHLKAKCADCHQPKFIRDSLILREKVEFRKKTYLGLGTECLACHKDVHGKMFARKKCLDCHDMERWKPAQGFDHDKDTRFDLRGKHVALECADCHKGGQPWELPPGKRLRDNGCITCHQDVHKGKFGRDCAKCHREEGFKKVKTDGFDHSRTKFPLEGKHAEVDCNQCHMQGASWVLTRFQRCADCHANFHKGEFTRTQRPERCEDCHSVQGFVPAGFGVKEHEKTAFPLKNAHLAIPCAACHTTLQSTTPTIIRNTGKNPAKPAVEGRGTAPRRKFRFASTDCIACHADPHRNQVDKYKGEAGCLACHSEASWKAVRFDHSLTGYALTGRHLKADCKDCHASAFGFKTASGQRLLIPDFAKRRSQCFECHEDAHQGQFQEKAEGGNKPVVRCDKCHTPTDWFAEGFDHDVHSRFKLEGAHAKARCDACHPVQTRAGKAFVRFKPLSMDCRSCHGDSVQVKKSPELKSK